MKKNFYAIKVGKGVKDKIITTWDECKKYVLHYNSIYKGFRTEKEAKKWLDSWNEDEIENRLRKQLLYRNRILREKILTDLNFKIDINILNFILENTYDYNSLDSFIDINIKDNKISAYKGKILKIYLKENINKT